MDIGILAGNVKRIRIAKQMSQSKLAKCSGVSLPAIKNIESEKNSPRVSTIQQIADALGVRLQELFVPVNELKSVRFRSFKKIQGREYILLHISSWLDDFTFVENSLNLQLQYKFHKAFQKSFLSAPEKLAAEVRKMLGLKADEPIYDICGLLESTGIKVYPFTYASDSFFGLAVNDEMYGPAVVVNNWEKISVERQIFSAAHELGHLLMHFKSFSVNEDSECEREENEANNFASYFLLPDSGFKKEWYEANGLHPVDRVMKVKRIYRVSYKTILYRLIENKMADEHIWSRFAAAYQGRYKRRLQFKEEPLPSAEPFGMERFDFYEDRLSKLVKQAVEVEAISVSRGAEILKISIEEMRDLLQESSLILQ